jgi:hypothetical protein
VTREALPKRAAGRQWNGAVRVAKGPVGSASCTYSPTPYTTPACYRGSTAGGICVRPPTAQLPQSPHWASRPLGTASAEWPFSPTADYPMVGLFLLVLLLVLLWCAAWHGIFLLLHSSMLELGLAFCVWTHYPALLAKTLLCRCPRDGLEVDRAKTLGRSS